MFLPAGWLTPVLPPTEESTVDITVVGTCASRMSGLKQDIRWPGHLSAPAQFISSLFGSQFVPADT